MGLSKVHKEWLNRHFGENVVYDEPMHRYTSFHIGGLADALVKPEDQKTLLDLILWCQKNRLPFFVLGKGTNLLVKDKGIRGIVISVAEHLNQISHEMINKTDVRITAMGGTGLQKLCRYAMDRGFGGLNFAVGIPGSVGGAVMMNAGTSSGCMADIIESITVYLFSSGVFSEKIKRIKKEQMEFSYRHFCIGDEEKTGPDSGFLIFEADFCLKTSDPETLKIDAGKKLKQRKATQPINAFSPGCIFKNPESGFSAGRLIEKAGLKGKKIGGVEVSSIHANYFVNHGQATAADVIELMQVVKDRVFDKFNITLEPEVVIAGE